VRHDHNRPAVAGKSSRLEQQPASKSSPAGPEAPSVPRAMIPHGIASDPRLTAVDVRVALGLLHWAWLSESGDRAAMSDWRLADYANVSEATTQRSLKRMAGLGLIQRDDVPYQLRNMTGRAVVLVWIKDPSVVVPPPLRDAPRDHTRPEGPSPVRDAGTVLDPSPAMDRVPHPRAGGSLMGEGEGPSPVRDKEDGRKKGEELSRTSSTMTTGPSSSSSEGALIQGKAAETEQAKAAVVKAFPAVTDARVRTLLAKVDPAIVTAAAHAYRPKGRASEWAYFLATCKGMLAEGGPPPEPAKLKPSDINRPKYHVAPPRPKPPSSGPTTAADTIKPKGETR